MATTRFGVMQRGMLLLLANQLRLELACMAMQLLADGAAAMSVHLAAFTSSSSNSSTWALASHQLVAASGAHKQAAQLQGCLVWAALYKLAWLGTAGRMAAVTACSVRHPGTG
jgi:hypothetical protein